MVTQANFQGYIELHFKYLFNDCLAHILNWFDTPKRKGISNFSTIQALQGKLTEKF
jgi:hypothetical protein